MSFDSLLQHRVTLERMTVQMVDADTRVTREFGGDVVEWAPIATDVACQVQALRTIQRQLREVPTTDGAGVDVGDFRIYMRPRDITTADRLYFDDLSDWEDAGVYGATEDTRLEILAIKNAGGRGHHLELEARLIAAPAIAVEEAAVS